MQQNSNTPWRSPMSHGYQLSHTVSMLNLHEEPTWHMNRGPPSPTASSVSSTTSRSTTPTVSNNPWSNLMASPSSTNSSPRESPTRTPRYTSRSATPIAPQPMRPIPPSTGLQFIPMSPPPSDVFKGFEYPGSPAPNFPHPGSPNPYRQKSITLPTLNNLYVTPALLTQYGKMYPELLARQGWERQSAHRAYGWACTNPRTALLLLICDEIAAWPKAVIYGLYDADMPFNEAHVQGIVSDPRKVLETQWRVTAKELPRNGLHTELTARETVPLQQVNYMRSFGNPEKSVDTVRWRLESDERNYVRKRYVLTRPNQQATLLKEVQAFNHLDHKNISKILCSYSQPSVFGIVTAAAQYTLDDYLALAPGDPTRSKLLLDWMNDLCQALDYLHSHYIAHRGIRPRKILIDGTRIYFAVFGIGSNHHTMSPTSATPQRLDQLNAHYQDQSYIYSAPEVHQVRTKKPGRLADVFSLGCVFLTMMTVIQSLSPSSFHQFRASGTQDASFHANLDRVGSWMAKLDASATANLRSGATGFGMGRRAQQAKSEKSLLECIERMIRADPSERIRVRKVVHRLSKYDDGKGMSGRRRSLEGSISVNPGGALTGGSSSSTSSSGSGSSKSGSVSSVDHGKPDMSVFDGYFSNNWSSK